MEPSQWVRRFAPLIPAGGEVCDLACGAGRHSRMLASLGYQVKSIDRDASALQQTIALATPEQAARITTQRIDLESGASPIESSRFDGIVVTNYLFRPLFPALVAGLKDGGVLIYETFARGNEHHGRPANPDFLLARNELLDAFGGMLHVVAFEQGLRVHPSAAVVQRICAVKAERWNEYRIDAGN